jgi:septum site-determining protein MinD
VMVLRPDQQDYEGTGVAVEVARSLEVPRLFLVVNKVPSTVDPVALKERLEATFDCEVAAVLLHSDQMMTLGSSEVFARKYPNDPITLALAQLVPKLLGGEEEARQRDAIHE